MAENLDQQVDNQDQQDTQTLNTETQDWKSNLSDEFKNDPTAEKFKDVDGLFKSYKSLQEKIGKDKVVVPGENASDEERSMFYSAIGRPDTPDSYKIPEETLNKIPPELRNEDERKEFSKVAHETGLTGQQYQKLMDWYYNQTGEQIAKQQQNINQSKKKGENTLRKEWGKAFDSKLQQGERVLDEFGNDKLRNKIKESGLNNDPEFIKFLSQAGEGLSEDTISGKPAGALMTPEQAMAEIAKVQGDSSHPYHKKDHAEHKFAVERMESLYEQAYPQK